MSQSLLAISYFLHLIATIVWIGGLVSLAAFVWPETQRALANNPGLYGLLTRLRKRFMPLADFSLVVLVFTGLAQMTADPNYDGVLKIDNEWSIVMLLKHLAIGGMLVTGLILRFIVAPGLERAGLLLVRGKGDSAEWERARRREVRLTWLNVLLAIAVLGFTAWATAI